MNDPNESDAVFNFPELLESCKKMLSEGAKSANHAFHFPVLGTLNEEEAELRTVVLRKVIPNPLVLVFYTDERSPKIAQIKKNNKVSWLFYDAKSKIQIRIKAKAVLHHNDEISQGHWDKLRIESRKVYSSINAPSTVIHSGEETENPIENEALIYQNFIVVYTEVSEIDWLKLDPNGNKRARFLNEKSGFMGEWLVP
ncbi:MAG: pyridoxamine 5'-phosphate oxidase family protein [Pelobium sp.]